MFKKVLSWFNKSQESSFKTELSYLSWERGPAIIGDFPEEGVTKAFFIPVGSSDWIKASGGQYGDIGENGGLMTKEEFENRFGVIGETLPELP